MALWLVRLVLGVLLGAVVFALIWSCRSPAGEFVPYRACLYDRVARRLFRLGTVIAERDDGSKLFLFDDRNFGDGGRMWIDDDATQRYVLRRCGAANGNFMEDR